MKSSSAYFNSEAAEPVPNIEGRDFNLQSWFYEPFSKRRVNLIGWQALPETTAVILIMTFQYKNGRMEFLLFGFTLL